MGNTTARFFNEKGPNGLKGTPFMMILCKRNNVLFSPEVLREAIRLFQPK